MQILTGKIEFPPINQANLDGLLCIGGDLHPERLLYAYKLGIFPMYCEGEPLLWWSPDPRFVLFPKDLKVSKSMKQVLRNNLFKITYNTCFKAVITACSNVNKARQYNTWITNDMILAYEALFHLGYAKSIEVWQNNTLVGGFYGVDTGNGVFSGESMFSKVSNASKAGLIHFIKDHNYKIIDCQMHTSHLESLGGVNITRSEFQKLL